MPRELNWALPSASTQNILPWGTSRAPTASEANDLERFVYGSSQPVRILGNQCAAYNCLSWSLGITNVSLGAGMNGSGSLPIEDILSSYTNRGFREVFSEDAADIAVWVKNGVVPHVSVRYNWPNGASLWTSKLGSDFSAMDSAISLLISHSLDDMAAVGPPRRPGDVGNYAGTVDYWLARQSQYTNGAAEDPGQDEPGQAIIDASRDFIIGMQRPAIPIPGYDPGEDPYDPGQD